MHFKIYNDHMPLYPPRTDWRASFIPCQFQSFLYPSSITEESIFKEPSSVNTWSIGSVTKPTISVVADKSLPFVVMMVRFSSQWSFTPISVVVSCIGLSQSSTPVLITCFKRDHYYQWKGRKNKTNKLTGRIWSPSNTWILWMSWIKIWSCVVCSTSIWPWSVCITWVFSPSTITCSTSSAIFGSSFLFSNLSVSCATCAKIHECLHNNRIYNYFLDIKTYNRHFWLHLV